MSTLREFMGVAIESDATRFTGDGYADERLGAVRGAVRRRRGVRSATLGGASVMGVGALIFGAASVPWNQFSPLTFAGGPTCEPTGTLAGADAVTVPEGATSAVVDNATGTGFFVGLVDGVGAAWTVDGSPVELTSVGEGAWTLTLPSGELVTLQADAEPAFIWVDVSDETAVAHYAAQEYAALVAVGEGGSTDKVLEIAERVDMDPTPSIEWDELSTIVVVNKAVGAPGESVTLTVIDGRLFERDPGGELSELPESGGNYTVVFPSGAEAKLSVRVIEGRESSTIEVTEAMVTQTDPSGEQTILVTVQGPGAVDFPADAAPEPTAPAEAVADDDCVTPEPEPSPSTSPSAGPSTEPTTGPFWDEWPAVPTGATPFECGFAFSADEYGTDEVRVTGFPTTDSAILETFRQRNVEQELAPGLNDTGAPAYRAELESADPIVGFDFVAVRDGQVVGTINHGTDGNSPAVVVNRADGDSPLEAFFWDLDTLTPCGASSVHGAEIYTVAGVSHGGTAAYAWHRVG